MTSLTDQFLNRLRDNVRQKSELPLPLTSTSNDSSFTEHSAEHNMLKPKINNVSYEWSDVPAIIFGMICGALLSILFSAILITWILSLIDIGNLTFSQVFGLLVIWTLIKPHAPND